MPLWDMYLNFAINLYCKKTNSLSMCSNYPLFIFLCPKIESKNYPWKKQSPWTIQIVSEKFWLCPKFFLCFSKTCVFYLMKIQGVWIFFTDTVGILENLHKFQLIIWDIAKISRIVFWALSQNFTDTNWIV